MDNNSEELEELENNSNYEDINEFEPVSEPDSSNSVKTEGVVKDAVGKMSKDALKSILKSPWFWGGIAVIALFLIVFLYLHADYDLFGVGEPKPKLYPKAPPCTGVYLTYENESYTKARRKKEPDYVPISDAALVTDLDEDDPEFGLRYTYKEYEYDTYISGIVWTDNKNALDVDNEIMYQAMAIAARSRLISELPNNCVVLKNYNEQAKSFTELTGSEEKYDQIIKGVVESNSKMIGRNGTVIKALYDPFSYTKKRLEEDEAKNNVYFYHMMNINEAEEQVVPAEWVDDLEKEKGSKIPKTHVDNTLKLGSMSLYGGKYLLEKVDSQYELYRILEYYYGRDLEYYYLSPDASNEGGIGDESTSGCMWWPIGGAVAEEKDGVQFASGPPTSVRITSPFGERNIGLEGASTNHKAIDIAGFEGVTYIIAAADGEVINVNTGCVAGVRTCGGKLGNYVKIKHNDGTITRYGHMFNVTVNMGEKVKQGQIIGRVGNTGNTTGPHLDFQVVVNGTPVNPLNYVSPTNPRKSCVGGGIIPGNDNSATICLSLKNNNYSDNAIGGLLSNFAAESGFNPAAVNKSSGASGIAQWLGGRLTNLKNTFGSDWIKLESQISFMLSELNSSYQRVNAYLRDSHSPSEMGLYVCTYYEVPAKTTEEARKYCQNSSRPSNSNNWANYSRNGCKE